MFQKKVYELFSGMPSVFSIADDILIVHFNEQGKDHDSTLYKVHMLHRQADVKLNEDKCLFRCTNIPFFGEIISHQGVSPNARKVQALTDMTSLKSRKELQSFLGILNYLGTFSPLTAKVCEPL